VDVYMRIFIYMLKADWIGWLTQRDHGVPSSANWKPTKPFNNKHQNVALIKPTWTAVNHYKAKKKKKRYK
jgi:hypothetical protein